MFTEEYRTLYQLLRQYQLENTTVSSKSYNACDMLLQELFKYYYDQNQLQKR